MVSFLKILIHPKDIRKICDGENVVGSKGEQFENNELAVKFSRVVDHNRCLFRGVVVEETMLSSRYSRCFTYKEVNPDQQDLERQENDTRHCNPRRWTLRWWNPDYYLIF